MWQRLGTYVIKNRLVLLIVLFAATAVMGFYASQVKLGYEFAKAIPTDNPKYQEYKSFQQKFGDDGNTLVAGIQTNNFFSLAFFKEYSKLHKQIRNVEYVEDVLSIPAAIGLQKDALTEKLVPVKIFSDSLNSQEVLDSAKTVFQNLSFYKSKLYNPETNTYLMAVRINREALNSVKRSKIVADITAVIKTFDTNTKQETHLSGLPLIRTVVGDRLQKEMRFFLIGSLVLSALILFLFFRSLSTTLLSLLVVLFGVIWSLGVLQLCGYKISILTALIAPLVVVIGVPNCIYFVNKYHTSYLQNGDKRKSLVEMVSKMGVVTLFCNITAAIGFAVFALTKSPILKEFGVVAGISIMVIFFISFILLPSVLSYLPSPKTSQTKYLNNRWLTSFLLQIERWVVHHKKIVYITTVIVLVFSIVGIFKLKSVAFIVDDLPKTDKVSNDLTFFEHNS